MSVTYVTNKTCCAAEKVDEDIKLKLKALIDWLIYKQCSISNKPRRSEL